MAFDLQVFNKQTQTIITETVAQEVDRFNNASGGTIVLQTKPAEGDFDITASFKSIAGLVRTRNVDGSDVLTPKRLEQLKEASVKVAAGTSPIEYVPAQYAWILKNQELAAIKIGEQLAKDRMAHMLNRAISATATAIGGQTSAKFGDGTKSPTFDMLNSGAALFGDRSSALRAWVMHSTTAHKLYANALANAERLFNYEGVNVMRDAWGRVFIVTDSDALVDTGKYKTLGLVSGAVMVHDNADFYATMQEQTGKENITATYQAEWSYNIGVQGYTWNTTAGGRSPSDTALGTSSNWVKTATSIKDTAGVLVLSA